MIVLEPSPACDDCGSQMVETVSIGQGASRRSFERCLRCNWTSPYRWLHPGTDVVREIERREQDAPECIYDSVKRYKTHKE